MGSAGSYDRVIRFIRPALVEDGFSQVEVFADHGVALRGSKTDLSDGERWRAGEVAAHVTTRFVVRYSAFTAGLTPADRLICEGITYNISGLKEVGGRFREIEITASARAD